MKVTRLLTVLLMAFLFSAVADSLTAQITHVPLYTFHGDDQFDGFGFSVSGAGDVDGDGFADLIVGAPGAQGNGTNLGSARVLSGIDGSVLHNFAGDSAFSAFGVSVSGAGDVNGDGLADLIVGAPGGNNNGPNSGSARVLSGIDGSVLYNFNGDSAYDAFGVSVSGAGDVNGDGRADMIVGATPGCQTNGSARVLSGIDGSVLYNFDGDTACDFFGWSVSGAGDVNGDGFADLIVGAPKEENNGFASGRARVLSGSDGSVLYNFVGAPGFGGSVSGAGDVNGDGLADLIVGFNSGDTVSGITNGSARVLSGSDGSVLYDFAGGSAGDFSVSGAGDVNGDGFADLIVGAHINNSGNARVVSGSDGSVLYSFDGDDIFDDFGISVSGAGDVNGDGLDDFIVGAHRGGANGGGYARVFVSLIASKSVLLGDVDLSGTVDFLDIAPFIAVLSDGTNQCEADCDQNGVVDFLDIAPLITILSGP